MLCVVPVETSQVAFNLTFIFSSDLDPARQLRCNGIARELHSCDTSLRIGDQIECVRVSAKAPNLAL